MKLIRPAVSFIKEHLGDNLIGAEVGVWIGLHSWEMTHYLKLKKLYCIDKWDNTYAGKIRKNGKRIRLYGRHAFKRAYHQLKDAPYVQFIRSTSAEAAKRTDIEPLDFVYIDADHFDVDNVNNDIKIWHRHVKKGGIVAGHDFGYRREPDVTTAVLRYCEKRKIQGYFKNYDWWFING